jgi:hypothetical protein
MASNPAVLTPVYGARTHELVFAGDTVRLAGQIDYPLTRRPSTGYPLVFVLPQAACWARDMYDDYTAVALERGYAVFRWDKRGTGRSGSSGTGSPVQDAVNAYETALMQPQINRAAAVILAIGAGTSLLGNCYGLFARIQNPLGVMLIGNMLDAKAIVALNTRIQILHGEHDWTPSDQFAELACAAHQRAYRHGAAYYIAPSADRLLKTDKTGSIHLHAGARKVMSGWLHSLLHPIPFA